MKNRNLLILGGIVILVVFLIGTTYAYMTIAAKSGNIADLSRSGKLDVVYLNGQSISGQILPTADNKEGLRTTVSIRVNEGSVKAIGTLTLHITTLSSGLAIQGLKWEIYKDSETTPMVDSNGVTRSGNFVGYADGDEIALVENYEILTTATTFTLCIWLDGADSTVDNSLTNTTFLGYISASATTEK